MALRPAPTYVLISGDMADQHAVTVPMLVASPGTSVPEVGQLVPATLLRGTPIEYGGLQPIPDEQIERRRHTRMTPPNTADLRAAFGPRRADRNPPVNAPDAIEFQ